MYMWVNSHSVMSISMVRFMLNYFGFLLNWSIWIPRGRSVFFFFKSWIPDRCFSDLSESSVAKSWFSPFIVCTETRSMLSRQLDFSLWSFRCDSLHWLVDFYIWLSWSYPKHFVRALKKKMIWPSSLHYKKQWLLHKLHISGQSINDHFAPTSMD